jgi:hypothetical protein
VRWRLPLLLRDAGRAPFLIGNDGASTGEPRECHPQLAEIGRVGIDYRLDGMRMRWIMGGLAVE